MAGRWAGRSRSPGTPRPMPRCRPPPCRRRRPSNMPWHPTRKPTGRTGPDRTGGRGRERRRRQRRGRRRGGRGSGRRGHGAHGRSVSRRCKNRLCASRARRSGRRRSSRDRNGRPGNERSAFAGLRFPLEVITVAVRWYLRYGLSYRDIEELLAERGVEVDHVTVYRWVQRFTPLFADAARPLRHATGDRWSVDETHVKVAGRWRYLYRAVDHRQVIDVLLSEQRDTTAARRFFTRALRCGPAPRIRLARTCGWWTTWSRPPRTSPSSTATTGSKPITAA